MKDQDNRYDLSGIIKLDDAYIGGKGKSGKRGRGAGGKVPIVCAVESRPKGCGHVALQKMAVSGHGVFFPLAKSSHRQKAF